MVLSRIRNDNQLVLQKDEKEKVYDKIIFTATEWA